ncbi:glutamate racemase [Halobacillus sp. ACCC02827]|uniref:glutamate racemase n=1 Tax=Bacillaceae TaxID=186817 RepID=UPI0002A4D770|nr:MULTISPECIES: glutamate racemase [Bacillaceae]ELK47229.1 glutamate racemase [Halobacillus sp. BAB-2008]QHT47345.1 glutamate racemase [Bacillus sp. SB49]WJE14568.1 glutamate racemase [Halobacillus sp. ACCC02827]
MKRPIGVIDSGVGGLTVARELMRQLPRETFVYLGDTKRCPYGPRSEEEVRAFTWQMVNYLLSKNIKMLVIACNTATAYTLKELQEELSIPVLGVIEPGARAAIKVSQNKRIGVIGTEGTIQSRAYPNALKAIDRSIRVNDLACPPFVPMVEDGILSGPEAEGIVSNTLKPLKEMNHIDTLILGCTHYPLIKDLVQREMGNHIQVISSGEETAREASLILSYQKALETEDHQPVHEFYSTGDIEKFRVVANSWFDEPVQVLKTVELEHVQNSAY